jgi:hypothetical protein
VNSQGSVTAQEARENLVLAALPDEVFGRLVPKLERVVLPLFHVLYEFDDQITHVYFPNRDTVISTLCRTDEQVNVEVALCGNEGMAGLTGIFGSATSQYQNIIQVPGMGSQLDIASAKEEFKFGTAFHGRCWVSRVLCCCRPLRRRFAIVSTRTRSGWPVGCC